MLFTEKKTEKKEIVITSLDGVKSLIDEEIQNVKGTLNYIDQMILIQTSMSQAKNKFAKHFSNDKHTLSRKLLPLPCKPQNIYEIIETSKKLINDLSESKKSLELELDKLKLHDTAVDGLINGTINEDEKVLLLNMTNHFDVKNIETVIKAAIQDLETKTNKDVQSVTPNCGKK